MTPRWNRLLLAGLVGLLITSHAVGQDQDARKLAGTLAATDTKDEVTGAPRKVHTARLEAGKIYRFDLASPDFDALLRLETAAGHGVTLDDDTDEANPRIVYQPAEAGEYRLIVSTVNDKVGTYALTIKEGTAAELLTYRASHIGDTPPAERKAVVAEVRRVLAAKGPKLGIPDAQFAMDLARGLEYGDRDNPALAAEAYTELGKLLAKSDTAQVAEVAGLFAGAGRRLALPGHPIKVRGTTADGKAVDIATLKGKVVLVDFWATWCGPCREELPNIKRLHDKYHGRGFEVIGVSLDQKKEALTKFLAAAGLPWPSILDAAAPDGESLASHYGVFAIPQAILVGRDGNVVSLRAHGEELERLLAELIPAKE